MDPSTKTPLSEPAALANIIANAPQEWRAAFEALHASKCIGSVLDQRPPHPIQTAPRAASKSS